MSNSKIILAEGENICCFRRSYTWNIFYSWHEAKQHVDGFPNNSYRAFKRREDAEKAFAEFASSSNQSVQNEVADFLDIQLKISNLKI